MCFANRELSTLIRTIAANQSSRLFTRSKRSGKWCFSLAAGLVNFSVKTISAKFIQRDQMHASVCRRVTNNVRRQGQHKTCRY